MRLIRSAAILAAAAAASVGLLLVVGPAGAVIGGTSDTANRYANVGVLQLHVGSDWFDFCSGTLVRADVVLTAAHCTDFLVEEGPDGFGPDDLRISFDPEGDAPYATVDHIVVNPDWFTAGPCFANSKHGCLAPPAEDIALVFLDAPVTGVTPAPIADAGYLDGLDLKSETFTVVGYGTDAFNRISARFAGAVRTGDDAPLVWNAWTLRLLWHGVDPGGAAQVEIDDLRVVQERRAGSLEPVASEIEDVTAARHRQRATRVLLDHQDRHAGRVDLANLLEDRLHRKGRQAGRGLVEQEQIRLGDERTRHREHLPLAAGQRPRPLAPALPEAREEIEHLRQAQLRVGPECRRAELEVLLDAERREHVLALSDVADALRDDAVRLRPRDLLSVQQHGACTRREQADHRSDQRRLACAVRTDDRDDLARHHGQVDAVEDVHVGDVAGDEPTGLEYGAGGAHPTTTLPRYASTTVSSLRTSCADPSAMTRPCAITITWSEWFITTSMSCSTKSTVVPSRVRISSMCSSSRRPSVGFTPASGSSRSTRRGASISARASSSSLRWPPESVPAYSPVWPLKSKVSSSSSARVRASRSRRRAAKGFTSQPPSRSPG